MEKIHVVVSVPCYTMCGSGWKDMDVLLMCVISHTHTSSEPPADCADAFRVLRTAVRDVLQTYKRDYGNNARKLYIAVCYGLL